MDRPPPLRALGKHMASGGPAPGRPRAPRRGGRSPELSATWRRSLRQRPPASRPPVTLRIVGKGILSERLASRAGRIHFGGHRRMPRHGDAFVAEHLVDPCDDVRNDATAAQMMHSPHHDAGGRPGPGELAGGPCGGTRSRSCPLDSSVSDCASGKRVARGRAPRARAGSLRSLRRPGADFPSSPRRRR